MNRVICRLAFRESGMYVIPIALTLLGYILLKLDPLRYYDTPVTIFSALLGFFLAWRSFADYGQVRAFLFSRPFTPARFFLVRWLFGLSILFGLGICIVLLLALGIRQSVQQLLFENGWFPMIRFEELRVVICYLIVSLFVYHSTLYFMLTNRFHGPIRFRGIRFWFRGFITLLLLLLGIGIGLFLLFMIAIDLFNHLGYPLVIVPYLYSIFGIPVLLQLILIPWFGIYCYTNQEIES